MNSKTKKSKAVIITLLTFIAILLVAGTTVLVLTLNSSESSDNTSTPQGVVFDNNASVYDKKIENVSGNKAQGIKVPGYNDITVASGSKDFPITLLNPEGNPCNFEFTLKLAETDETICTTNLVKPGNAIQGVTLSKALEKGEYTLLIDISTYSLEGNSRMNGAQVKTSLSVI